MNSLSAAGHKERTVDALVLSLFIDVVKVAQDLDEREVLPRIVDDALRAVLDEVLEQGEGLCAA